MSIYEVPERVLSATIRDIPVVRVKVGDVLADVHQKVTEVKFGTKYIRVLSGPVEVAKVSNTDSTTMISVIRHEETAESQSARKRALQNQALESLIADPPGSKTLLALGEMTAAAEAGQTISTWKIEDLIVSQCNDRILAEFAQVYAGRDNGEDHVDAYARFTDFLKDRLINNPDYYRGLSRSTSQTDNLINDVMRECIIKLINRRF